MAGDGMATNEVDRAVPDVGGLGAGMASTLRGRGRRGGRSDCAGTGPQVVAARGTVAEVVRVTREEPPDDASTHWTTRTLAARFGIGKDTVARIWRDHQLKPWQVEHFKLSNDQRFEEKLVDVVGLYMDPPERAIVFSFDEKTQCQALDRTQPSLPLKPGRAATMTHDYKRNGTTDLFAAMNVATGEVLYDCRPRHTGTDVLAFFRLIDLHVPAGLDVHVVLDNLSAHMATRLAEAARPSEAGPLAPPLHPHHLVVAEPCRRLVQPAHPTTPPPRHLHQRRRPRRGIRSGPTTGTTTPNPSSGHKPANEIIVKVQRGRATLTHLIKSATHH